MKINGDPVDVPQTWQDASLLDFLRDGLGLTGTKYGCGKGLCGACSVHVNGSLVRSCITPLRWVAESDVTTIEGLSGVERLHPVQQAWIELNVPQCGYCQPGQIMTAAAFLSRNSEPSETEVAEAMHGNLCRCGTYPRIRRGVLRAAQIQRNEHE